MVGVRPPVRGFRPVSEKRNQAINFKCSVCIYWVNVQNFFAFGRRWPNFGPLVATKWRQYGKMVVFHHYLKKYSRNLTQTCCLHLMGVWSEFLNFGPMLDKFWPSRDHKMTEMLVSCHYLKKYSYNLIQTWCVHLLGKSSDLIRFGATLAKFWSSSGHKITENGCFLTLYDKVFTQSNSNLLSSLIGWVFRIDLLSAPLAKFGPSSVQKMTENGGFPPLSGKVFTKSNSNLATLIGLVFRIDSLLGHFGQILEV